ncbi:MAG: hypothetical protein RBT36_00105 [Desulfobulbus sp.]|jgi:hypothetical protein|nr:hypothetical protein [Desulfobulbus sp.]
MTPEERPLWQLSEKARQAITAIYRTPPRPDDEQQTVRSQIAAEVFGAPAGDLAEASFLGVVEYEARWAREGIAALNDEPDRKAARKELADLHKHLARAVDSLNSLSLSARVLLPVEFDHLQAITDIELAAGFIDQGLEQLKESPRLPHRAERREAIARELALRLLRAVRDYGIGSAATFEEHEDDYGERSALYQSSAVQLLYVIGADIDLNLSPHSWKRHILEAFRPPPA